jgi:hypothetical protein
LTVPESGPGAVGDRQRLWNHRAAQRRRELPPLVHDSRRLHARRAQAHAPGSLVPVAGADHFTIPHELHSPTGVLVRQARALV